ncbi:MAG: polysaccharide pyruvyl transferase family protein [Anaerolineaceae bacterium]|nr:polysaccharide pyruvyl transferase family protein [Anaerolineaceae bacterium]
MKLKIDVITLHAVQNYGSVLQALATQSILEGKGCQVRIINYVRKDIRYDNILEARSGGNLIKKIILFPSVRRWQKVFETFNREHLHLTDTMYSSEADFADYCSDADAFCTGSDQVWNSKWNGGILPEFYFSFVPENKFKFSFSASFGQSVLSDEEVKATAHLISQYRFISVREDTGKKIIEEQYHYPEATVLLDPTLLMEASYWRKMAAPRAIKEDYILIYNLNRSREFDRYAKELSRKTGLKLVRLCTRYDQFYRAGKSVFCPEVNEFISLIDNARYVLTDSFHATAFSMNMNTEPICVYPKEFSSRLNSFLRLTNSLQRHITGYDDFDVVNRPVDFNEVNSIMVRERNKAGVFLDRVVNSIRNEC